MIAARNICKRFGNNPVLRDVSFSLTAGHILGLVGENGAGKSTLMNIIGGNLQADSGILQIGGESYDPQSPADAAHAGIAFIHQELNLFPNLSIAENLLLNSFPQRFGVIKREESRTRTAALLRQVGLDQKPDTKVEVLSAGERQLVEIAKALAQNARLIIFDEPTTSLSSREAEHLFGLIGQLRARGVSMIYISHALADVLRLGDELLVLRDGQAVSSGPRAGFDIPSLVTQMVGRNLSQLYPPRTAQAGEQVVLEARGLSHPGVVRDISFRLHRGEILGVAGLMGAGRSELARILFGLERCASGSVLLGGRPLEGPPRERIREGLAFLTENRREEGLCLGAGIADNLGLAALRDYIQAPPGLLSRPRLQAATARIREAVRLSPAVPDSQPVRILSGGNQQKVVLGKWLMAKPKVLILDEPTRGIDVGARYEIYVLIDRLAAEGAAVLMISSELEELIGLCDRILVMSRGEITDELPRAAFDRERILKGALHK